MRGGGGARCSAAFAYSSLPSRAPFRMAAPASSTYGIAAIGTSWGGLDALTSLLGLLPPSLPFPVVVVQHRGI